MRGNFPKSLVAGLRRRLRDDKATGVDHMSQAGGVAPVDTLLQEVPVFFLVGWAKSGTSWLMRLLDAHPEILCRGEGRFFGRDFRLEGAGQGRSKNVQPGSLYGAIADSEYLRGWTERSVWTRGDDPEQHLANLTWLATNYFLTQQLAKSGKKIVGDKTPISSTEIVREISEVYPQARVIHIIRDGRDVAVSTMHHVWNHAKSEGGIYDLSREELEKRDAYRADPEAFSRSGESLFAGQRLANISKGWKAGVERPVKDAPGLLGSGYAEVRYEDLLERPRGEIRRLLEFLGASYDKETVGRCVEMSSFERMSNRKRGKEDSASFFRKGVAGDWKNVFTDEDRRVFKEAAGDLLIELGYEKDGRW